MIGNSSSIQESVQEKKLQYSDRKSYECRVCLEEMRSDQLVETCDCKGDSGAIHKECLLEWIQKSNKKYQKMQKYYYKCEVCLTQMELQTKFQVNCKASQTQEQTSVCTLISTIFILVSMIAFGVCFYLAVMQYKDGSINKLHIFGMVASFIAIIFTIFLYLCKQVMHFDTKIVDVKSIKQSVSSKIIKKNGKKNDPIINSISKKITIKSRQQIRNNNNPKFRARTRSKRRPIKQFKNFFPNLQNQLSLAPIDFQYSIQ